CHVHMGGDPVPDVEVEKIGGEPEVHRPSTVPLPLPPWRTRQVGLVGGRRRWSGGGTPVVPAVAVPDTVQTHRVDPENPPALYDGLSGRPVQRPRPWPEEVPTLHAEVLAGARDP